MNVKPDCYMLCEPVARYSSILHTPSLFERPIDECEHTDIRVIELFAGVGGFRIGLERASSRYKTIWNNQWEPSTKRQDASLIYQARFGVLGHSNQDIATVDVGQIPEADMLVGGFPCQDYSVATTLNRSGGIEGKKGVLWWEIYRILKTHPSPPGYLLLENVDRLLCSPASQRGRDFAIILSSLSELGYIVEWRVINAAEYGMPQKRKRTYIIAYHKNSKIGKRILGASPEAWMAIRGVMARAFPIKSDYVRTDTFTIDGDIRRVSENFNRGKSTTPFKSLGMMLDNKVYTRTFEALYSGVSLTLGDVLLDERLVPPEFFVPSEEVAQWEYLKGHKSMKRINKATGFEYTYSEGAMAFPDWKDTASRTIITGEGGRAPSRFKHIIKTESGRYRRLTPVELERLNMFPDGHTREASDLRRAFLMGNALVTGIVERIGISLLECIDL